MEGSSAPADPASLCESYQKCIDAFRRFILALGEDGCRVIHLEQAHLPDILDQYGRAKIWGDQSRADLPARARGSLDDTLRHEEGIKKTVRVIFMRLERVLDEAISIAEKKYNPEAGEDYDSISSVSADSDSNSNSNSDSDSDDDAGADGKHQRRSKPKIRLLVQMLVRQIEALFGVSSILRRPKVADKYIRSVNSKLDASTSRDPDTLPLSLGFNTADENHVVEKVMQWRGLTKAEKGVMFEEEGPAAAEAEVTREHVEDILWFCQRLARANTRRREQLQYWNAHPYDSKKDAPKAVEMPSQPLLQAPAQQIGEAQEVRSQTSTLKPPDPNVLRPGPKSAFSKQSFSTAAVSLVHDTKTNVRPKTVYAPTAIGKARTNSVPDPPRPKDGSDTFSCPYCGTSLDCHEMENRQSWQRHVFRDLRPYVCTFEDCQNAGKLYVSRHEWTYHELQVHRREYLCKECDKRFPTREEAEEHFRGHYGESISGPRLSVIIDLSERQVDVSRGEKEQCLICGEELSLLALQTHLANHLEDVALFVLPSTEEDEESGDSKASVKVAKLLSQGGASDLGSDCQSLGFSAAGDHKQNLLDFEAQVLGDEMGYTSKISYWESTRVQDDDITAHGTRGVIQEQSRREHEPVLIVEDRSRRQRRRERELIIIVENPPTALQGVSYEAWKATSRDHDGHTTANIWGYLFPADLQHDQFLVMGKPTHMDGDDATVAKTSSRPPRSYLVGRDPQCELVLHDPEVSNHHFSISHSGGLADLKDLSTNGTYLNGVLVGFEKVKKLKDGDKIHASDKSRFIFCYWRRSRDFVQFYDRTDELKNDTDPSANQHLQSRVGNHRSELLRIRMQRSERISLVEQDQEEHINVVTWARDGPIAHDYLFTFVNRSTRKLHAVKILITRPPSQHAKRKASQYQSFERQEVTILMRIRHDHILSLTDTFQDYMSIHLVFDGVPTDDLASATKGEGSLSEDETVKIFGQIFRAVKYLHDLDIVHRDIRPQNVLFMGERGQFKLTNFASAVVSRKGSPSSLPSALSHYSAPEMFTGREERKCAKAVDIWSLGATLARAAGVRWTFEAERCSEGSALQLEEILRDGVIPGDGVSFLPTWWLLLAADMVLCDPEKRLTIADCIAGVDRISSRRSADYGGHMDLVYGLP